MRGVEGKPLLQRPSARLLLVLVASSAVGLRLAAAQPADRVEEARKHVKAAQEASGRGDYTAALAHLRAADELTPNGRLHFGIGEVLVALGRNAEALDAYEQVLELVPDAPEADKAREMVARLTPKVGRILLDGIEPGAVVQLDKRGMGTAPNLRPLRVDPGSHDVVITRIDAEAFRKTITVDAGKTVRIDVALPKREVVTEQKKPPETVQSTVDRASPHRSSKLPMIMGGGAILLGGVAVGMSFWGDATYDDAKQAIDNPTRKRLYESANNKRYAAEALGVAALGCAGGALWLYLRDRRAGDSESAKSSMRIAPSAAPGLAAVSVTARF